MRDSVGQPKERAYTAGLLHDIGRLALMAQFPDEYGELLTIARHGHFNQIECERELFDIDHCQAGGWLAGEWNFPEDLVNSIALHHSGELKEGSLPFVVSAACRIADILGFGVLQTEIVPNLVEGWKGGGSQARFSERIEQTFHHKGEPP